MKEIKKIISFVKKDLNEHFNVDESKIKIRLPLESYFNFGGP